MKVDTWRQQAQQSEENKLSRTEAPLQNSPLIPIGQVDRTFSECIESRVWKCPKQSIEQSYLSAVRTVGNRKEHRPASKQKPGSDNPQFERPDGPPRPQLKPLQSRLAVAEYYEGELKYNCVKL